MKKTCQIVPFETVERLISIASNIAVIAGIVFAFIQVDQSNQSEKRLVAIEAIRQTRTDDFIKSYTRVKSAFQLKVNIAQDNSLIDDINFIKNTYDNIAILYLNDLGDKNIIREAIYLGVKDFYLTIKGSPLAANISKSLKTFIDKMESEK